MSMNPKRLLNVTLFITMMLATPALLKAQRVAGDVGIGLQIGEPSGLSIATYRPNGVGIDILAAWDLVGINGWCV